MDNEIFITRSEDETIELGEEFAERLRRGDVVALQGDLGAGKTEFIKGICKYFKVEELVTSPTFTIMNQYNGEYENKTLTIYHIDLYRIKDKKELEEIGFEECVYSSNSIKLIEWSEKAESLLPQNKYLINIRTSEVNEEEREIQIYTPDYSTEEF